MEISGVLVRDRRLGKQQMYDQLDTSNFERFEDDEALSILMKHVSEMFGGFDPDVVIRGVYFGVRRYPHTVYPFPNDPFIVDICIPRHQSNEPLAITGHLSHELVHCLRPNGFPPQATLLEEGLAEHAKVYLVRKFYGDRYPNFDFKELSVDKYRQAFNKIEELVGFEGLEGMREGIRNVRATTGLPFSQITEYQLAKQFVNSPNMLLKELSQRFRN